jgi:transcriptional regulator GlxA family with amidase domain
MLAHVRFQPGSLFRLLRIPMHELVNKNIDADLILGNEIHEVEDKLARSVNYDQIPLILDAFFAKMINRVHKKTEPIDRIGRLIMADPQGFSLEKTANAACLSNRQFERRFMLQIGVRPKYFARICRFYQAYLLYEEQPQLGWYHIALQSGYTDYQHLAKDFKHFSGTTPNLLLLECSNNPEERLKMNDNTKGV